MFERINEDDLIRCGQILWPSNKLTRVGPANHTPHIILATITDVLWYTVAPITVPNFTDHFYKKSLILPFFLSTKNTEDLL